VNKLCDAADWMSPELSRIIRDAFAEPARFHRKQWELAVIYRELERLGLLDGTKRGISFGSGTERLLYALAHRVEHLWATDLYGTDAPWGLARTNAPLELIQACAPFAYPAEKLSAKRMDMRFIQFPNESFDFAYSACAIGHIGREEDFVQHLKEARRVLKPGGVYVFTTELTYDDQPLGEKGNYHFSRELLGQVIAESGLSCDAELDAQLFPHAMNTPLPVELARDGARLDSRLFDALMQVQLTLASSPFTSCVVVLRRAEEAFRGWSCKGWDETRRFIDERMEAVQQLVEGGEIILAPFAGLPDQRSYRYVGHDHYFRGPSPQLPLTTGDEVFFQTPHVWLGDKPRILRVALRLTPVRGPCVVELELKRADVKDAGRVVSEKVVQLELRGRQLHAEIELRPQRSCRYALVGKLRSGDASLVDVQLAAAAAGHPRVWDVQRRPPLPAPTPATAAMAANMHSAACFSGTPPLLRRFLDRIHPPASSRG
jgi:SAM-dependent methyltransferase